MILHNKTEKEFGYTFNTASNTKKFYCICDYCGKEFLRAKRTIQQCNQIINKDSCGVGSCKRQKSEEVQVKKFGVKNFGGTKESIEKRKKTCLDKYGNEIYQRSEQYQEDSLNKFGVEHHTQADEWKNKIKEVHLEKRGVDHHTKDKEYQDALKVIYLEKYGVDHFMKTDEFKNKIKNRMVEKYGKYYSQTDECKDKVKNTNQLNFQTDYPMQSDEVKLKVAELFQQKYGQHYSKTEDFKEKCKKTNLEKYGQHYSKTEDFKEKVNNIFDKKYGKHFLKTEEFREKYKDTCIKKYGVDHYSKTKESKENFVKKCLERYGTPYPNNTFGKVQVEIKEWLNSFGFDFGSNYSILDGKEIDLYEENLQLGIEYCGLYWHNEYSLEPRLRDYHYNKYKNCLDKGIRLITIFEDEWLLKNKQCKDYLKSVLGKFEQRIYARKCTIKEISKKEVNDFYNENHILGSSPRNSISFGLYHQDDLVGAISFGKHHRQTNHNELILTRLCFKSSVQVIGGASKLFKRILMANSYTSIVSWSDNRWSDGNIYKILGFTLDKDIGPDYSYVDLSKRCFRISKQSQKKSSTKCPKGLTEKQWCLQRGLARIWDCGKKRWIYDFT